MTQNFCLGCEREIERLEAKVGLCKCTRCGHEARFNFSYVEELRMTRCPECDSAGKEGGSIIWRDISLSESGLEKLEKMQHAKTYAPSLDYWCTSCREYVSVTRKYDDENNFIRSACDQCDATVKYERCNYCGDLYQPSFGLK